MDDAILECLQEERPITFIGTLDAANARLGYSWRRLISAVFS